MKKADLVNWVKTKFQPIELVETDEVILQHVDDAIRYWNTHSAHRCMGMYSVGGQNRIALSPSFKNVVRVIPANSPQWMLEGHPLWTLLGVTVLDNVTSDMVLMAESFNTFKTYIGGDLRWKFIGSDDPENLETPPYLFLSAVPSGTTKCCVIGTKRILRNEDIKNEYIIDWLTKYIWALVKRTEGTLYRKAGLIDAANDGQALYDEGENERKELESRLALESRWVVFVKRC